MSLHPSRSEVPVETARVAAATFPHGTVATRLRDEFAALYEDEDFRALYPARGQPALAPWRLALVTVFQLLEHLSDRQAAGAVRARIDWKYALGLELTDLQRAHLRISLDSDHPFRTKSITRFARSRSPISLEADQSLWMKPITR